MYIIEDLMRAEKSLLRFMEVNEGKLNPAQEMDLTQILGSLSNGNLALARKVQSGELEHKAPAGSVRQFTK